MSDPIGDAETNDPEMTDTGPNSFEARARKASASVRQQLAAPGPDDELGLRRTRRPIHRMAVPRVAAAAALGVDPQDCALIGDIGADVGAALAAGARPVLVPTPVTRREEVAAAPLVAPDLLAAVDLALELVSR